MSAMPLFNWTPTRFTPSIIDTARLHDDILSQEFISWLPANVHIWEAFKAEVMKVIRKGFKHYSSRTIIEALRHHSAISETGIYKINDHCAPGLARLFEIAYPEHKGMFEKRETKNRSAL